MMAMGVGIQQKDIPKHIERKLKRDATRLAIRLEAQGEDLSLQKIEISQKKTKEIYNLLVSIYQSDLPEAATVFNCNIRAATSIAIDKFWVVYDKNADWANALLDDVYEVEGKVSDLIDEYDLFITDKKTWDDSHDMLTIESTTLYNIEALAQKFQGIDGIHKIITNNLDMAPDSDIDLSFKNGNWHISFIRKWSSLQDKKSHSWNFLIDQEGKVNLVDEKGDELPMWMQCELLLAEEKYSRN